MRYSKDGKKAQVRLKRGPFAWVDVTSLPPEMQGPPTTLSEPSGPRVVAKTMQDTYPPFAGSGPSSPEPAAPRPPKMPTPIDRAANKVKAANLGTKLKMTMRAEVLSNQEADAYLEVMKEALPAITELMDKGITATITGHATVIIWSDMDESETDRIAEILVFQAKHNEKIALAVRTTATLYQQGQIALILLPRFYKTYMTYVEFGFDMPAIPMTKRRRVRSEH